MSNENNNEMVTVPFFQNEEQVSAETMIKESIADLKRLLVNTQLTMHASDFFCNYCHIGPFYKVGFLGDDNHVSFPAVAWYDPEISKSSNIAKDLTFFYPGDPDCNGFETIQRLDYLTYIKEAIRKGWKPEALVAFILPEQRSSDKMIRLRLEASLGTICKESMAYDYVYWVFTGKRWSWLFTEGEFLDLKV